MCPKACNWTETASYWLADPACIRCADASALLFFPQPASSHMCLAESFPGVGLAGSTCPKTTVRPVPVSHMKLLGSTCPVEFTSDLLQDAALFHRPGQPSTRQAPCSPLPAVQRDQETSQPLPSLIRLGFGGLSAVLAPAHAMLLGSQSLCCTLVLPAQLGTIVALNMGERRCILRRRCAFSARGRCEACKLCERPRTHTYAGRGVSTASWKRAAVAKKFASCRVVSKVAGGMCSMLAAAHAADKWEVQEVLVPTAVAMWDSA